MRFGLVGAAAAVLQMTAPFRREKGPRWAPAELRDAPIDILERCQLAQDRTAIVLSLWAERPAKQCTVTPRYAVAPGTADFSRVVKVTTNSAAVAAPKGARALLGRLHAAGYSAAEPSEAASFQSADNARRAA